MALAGHLGDSERARSALVDLDPLVRATAFAALVRLGSATDEDVRRGLADRSPLVRRRALELAWRLGSGALAPDVAEALVDDDPSVVEAACFSIGEMRHRPATDALVRIAGNHPDPLCRESAVAALGAIGDPLGLAAVLAALEDRPAIRRRAVLALASFEGANVEAAIATALSDRDWQVRQAAEDLSGSRPLPPRPGGAGAC